MSTNANLPEGFKITSINGRRCTQVPRSLTTIAGETSFATTTTESPAQTTTSTTPLPETTTSSAQVQGNSPNVAASVISTSSAAPTTSIATPEPETTTSSTPPPAAATTAVAPVETATPAASSTSITFETSTSASPASKGTTPTISSITSVPILQSELSATPTPTSTGIFNDANPSVVSTKSTTSVTATTASAHAEESSAVAGISSSPKLAPAPVVGGVMGGIALIGIIGLILWFFRRKRRRDSLLTPLTTGTREQFYEIDRGSVGPTKPLTKWKANLGYQTEKLRDAAETLKAGVVGIAGSLKSKVSGDRSDTPSVNLNRGNSQFLDGPIPQHSRNNSSVLSNHTGHLTVKDRFNDWWERFTENVSFKWRLRRKERQSMDPFASARSMTEKQANINGPPNFSQLLGMDDREMQLQAERRRASLSQSFPSLGTLGLDFSSQSQPQAIADPFADPPNSNAKTQNQPLAPLNPSSKPGQNPFADPITAPQRSIPKQNTYISDIRRSRGLSVNAAKPTNPSDTNSSDLNLPPSSNNKTTSIAPTSRYPSSIAPSRDSYRDTVFSSFSANVRKGKGRSDPFDLERPELWRPKVQNPPMPTPRDSTKDLYTNPLQMGSGGMSGLRGPAMMGRDSQGAKPRVVSVSTPRIVSAGTYGSKYSSGVSSLGGWGDPGPDLGSGSVSQGSSLRGEVGSISSEQVYGQGSGSIIKGSLAEMSPTGEGNMEWDMRRARDNMSPVSVESKASSRGGVGKAI